MGSTYNIDLEYSLINKSKALIKVDVDEKNQSMWKLLRMLWEILSTILKLNIILTVFEKSHIALNEYLN